MLTEITHAATQTQADSALIEAAWQRIRQHLEAEKQQIFQEIRHYPPPIPACDVQFNGLLAERAAILQALGRVESILQQGLTGEAAVGLLDDFLRTSPYVDDALAASIDQSLTKVPGINQQLA